MALQITLIVITSDNAHHVFNNGGEVWSEWRGRVLDQLVRHMIEHHASVRMACFAHNDHFHIIKGQKHILDLLAGLAVEAGAFTP